MIKPVPLFACLSFVAITACAAPVSAPTPQFAAQSRAPQCFRVNEVYAYSPGPEGMVQLQTAQGPFQMRLGRGCPDFSWIMQIGIRPMEASWLCEGHDDVLITGDPVPRNACTVSEVQSLAPAAFQG